MTNVFASVFSKPSPVPLRSSFRPASISKLPLEPWGLDPRDLVLGVEDLDLRLLAEGAQRRADGLGLDVELHRLGSGEGREAAGQHQRHGQKQERPPSPLPSRPATEVRLLVHRALPPSLSTVARIVLEAPSVTEMFRFTLIDERRRRFPILHPARTSVGPADRGRQRRRVRTIESGDGRETTTGHERSIAAKTDSALST